ncbi:hypothetical protein [Ancylobacter sp. TS-1]|uniref:hypothetical protein n=1 Tax=Ancylobacter sp. TS-1 TaxID=1850374 RepID=UPI00192E63BD|nr:hypothetical protein [Ancylobacter sp. TS-1]
MPIIDDRTPVRDYPLPAQPNWLSDDVLRLREALGAVAVDVAALLEALAGKAPLIHGHGISAVTGLGDALAGKLPIDWRPALDDLTDVSVAAATNRMVLMRIGASWQAAKLLLADIEGWEDTVDGKVSAAVAGLVASAPGALDTLAELAAALGNDPNYANTIATALGYRLRFDAAQVLTGPQRAQGLTNLGISAAAQALLVLADAPAIFGAIKQVASDTATGVVELATPAEAAAGVDTSRAVTSAGVAAAIAALTTPGLGVGQAWSNQARSTGTAYQNATGRPIMVVVTMATISGGIFTLQLSVNGTAWVDVAGGGVASVRGNSAAVVPDGHFYRMTVSPAGGASITSWSELR